MSSSPTLCTPRDASLLTGGAACLLIDVREPFEFAAERIEGSLNHPLASLAAAGPSLDRARPLVLICRSGNRARQAARLLAGMGFAELRVMEGGVLAWKKAGLPLTGSGRAVWSLDRQVRLTAGSLVLLGLALYAAIGPWGLLLSGVIGAGLAWSAITDSCAMGAALSKMPWNRP